MEDKIDTSPEGIFRGLREVSPDIAFSMYWDENPNPIALVMTQQEFEQMRKDGFREYSVDVSAITVIKDQVVEAKSYMSGFFYKPGELDPTLNGYLPEVLLRVATDLSVKVDFDQADKAVEYLKEVKRLTTAKRR